MGYQILADRYQVGDVVGRGGMSEVHRGLDRRLSRDVAVKVLRKDLARNPGHQERFRREAQNAASLNHPNIVAVYDSGEMTDRDLAIPYIVMEWVDGEVLRDALERDGPPAPHRAAEIVGDICLALDFSHRRGVVHRDVKPANVMLSRSGTVKVMDFGVARAGGDDSAPTTATAVIGNAHYLSPEQASGQPVDVRSDIYATGCVLYELLCGTPPFTGRSPIVVANKHVREAPRPPSERRAGIPKDLDAVALKALSKNPLNRYQSAAEMRADLRRAVAGLSVDATPVMSERERHELHGAPVAVGAVARGAGSAAERAVTPRSGPALLAPVRTAPPMEPAMPEPTAGPATRVWRFVALGAVGVAVVIALVLTVLVVTAPPPPPKVAVPDVTGLSVSEAVAVLQEKNLTLGAVVQVDSPQNLVGKVINQRPSERTHVDAETPVNLEVDAN